MKITEVTTINGTRMHGPDTQWFTHTFRSVKADICVVQITTDSGLVGIGEACAYGNPVQIADWVSWLSRTLVGFDIEDPRIVPHPTGTSFARPIESAFDYAVAAIDCAIWDLRARAESLPVSRLLNPQADDSVQMYASGGVRYDWRSNEPGQLVDDLVDYVSRGYSAVKFRLGTNWAWDGVTPERFLELFDLVRKELGDGVGLAVDANSRLTREEAQAVAYGLDERGALFFEEPIAKKDIEGYVAITGSVSLPISGGETFTTLEQFRPWLERGAFNIAQPDAGVCGITELMSIGRMAENYGIDIVPHSWHNGLMAMANAHAVAALPNGLMVEESIAQGPLVWDSIKGGTRVHGGRIAVGNDVGLGVEVVDDLESIYPYVEGHYGVEVYR
jgi:L-alanine-DL-glutamate epimerase-like enolase superfamily enzyme